MSDGIAHEGACLDDGKPSDSLDAPRWPNSPAVLEALAALEAEFNAILKSGAAVPK
jgi:hypothetical protein